MNTCPPVERDQGPVVSARRRRKYPSDARVKRAFAQARANGLEPAGLMISASGAVFVLDGRALRRLMPAGLDDADAAFTRFFDEGVHA